MQLTNFNKGRLIGMLEAGMSIRNVEEKIGCTKRTVDKWWSQYRTTGNVNRQSGSGRPRKSDERTDRHLIFCS